MALVESICYNLREVYGPIHHLTVECETLRASVHNTCGNHRAARDIHVHLLERIGNMNSEAVSGCEDLVDFVMGEAKRLKSMVGDEDDKDESFYMPILMNAQNSITGHHRSDSMAFREAMTLDGEKRETKWKHPDNWSLRVREVQ
ncbi:hypothetical protein DER44DRAFT_857603 [Fusarium oxysporum]|nr:hypothetical protein DER44DRAFT_857603 [Fusarium oxysporum]